MKTVLSGAAALASVFCLASSPANAAPLSNVGGLKDAGTTTSLQQVHYRPYRHCHWRHGYRRCHGGYGYRYGYGYGPGVYLNFGGRRHHHHHRHHRRGRHRR
jgi:hypothetical protein